jgi:hypothetical protein
MKIFGHYIFEEDPEYRAHREMLERKEREESYVACARKDDDPYTFPLPSGWHDYREGSEKDHFKWDLEKHKEKQKKKMCHYYYDTKYCYHTGKEIVIGNNEMTRHTLNSVSDKPKADPPRRYR